MDEQDIGVFLSYIKTYLLPRDEKTLKNIIADPVKLYKERIDASRALLLNNFSSELEMTAYTTMPNHFHFLVYQTAPDTIDRFMNSLGTRYTMYFNKRYKRVGPLFQGIYKGVLVESDEQSLYLSRYIHRNVRSLPEELRSKFPSSYPVYLGKTKQEWVKPERILAHFSTAEYDSYREFVEIEDMDENNKEAVTLSKVGLDI
jgi:REP element-mobilizing transposase RayT